MKTPKRIAYCSCGCALNLESGDYMDDKGQLHNSTALFCPKCGAEHPGEAFASRCIRKNREARLRNALENQRWEIIRLSAALDFQRRGGKAVKEEYMKHLHIAERAAFYGTYGQDIEGS